MARTWTKSEWDDEKWRIAEEAVKSRMAKKKFDGKSQTFIDAVERELLNKAKAKLDEDFKYDALKDTEKDVISKWKAEDADNYLLGGGNAAFKNSYNPLVKKKMDDFAKLGPLVLGLADKGRDWYSMGQEDLFYIGDKLGYDTSTKKGKMDFLNDIADVQKAHDRGKMLEEFNRGNNILSELFYPTLMEEARRQITTGQGTQEQLDNAKKLDIAANFLIGAAPVIGEGSRVLQGTKLAGMAPIIGGAVGAGAQGGLEAGRQRIKEEIDPELEADYAAALLASTIGATRPGMIGTASTIAQQIPGKPMARFSRGISSATRRGNPTNAEREEFETAMKLFKNFSQGKVKPVKGNTKTESIPLSSAKSLEDIAASQNAILIDNYGVPVRLNQIADAQLASKVPEKLEALYGKQRAAEILGSLDAQQVLKDYDAISKMWVKRNPNNFLEQVVPQGEVVNGKYMSGDYLKNLEKAFPSKVSEAYGNDAWYKAGLGVGALFGGVGGSVEPALKANPLGPISGGRANIMNNDYKEAAWYKKLSKKQQEAFDDAYEKAKKANK
jgi:hypothetical protein